MKKRVIGSLAITSVLLGSLVAAPIATMSTAAFAQQGNGQGLAQGKGPGMGQGKGQGMGQGAGRMGPPENTPFESIDADGNGKLSKTEVNEWAEGLFGAMDADSNGSLTLEEYMAVRMGPGADGEGKNPARQEAMQSAKAERFHAMDTNSDGVVSHEEFTAFMDARFKAANPDGNGEVSRQQWGAQQ